jgi:hypothetical protein
MQSIKRNFDVVPDDDNNSTQTNITTDTTEIQNNTQKLISGFKDLHFSERERERSLGGFGLVPVEPSHPSSCAEQPGAASPEIHRDIDNNNIHLNVHFSEISVRI